MSEVSHTFEKGVLKVVISENSAVEEFAAVNGLAAEYPQLKLVSIDLYKCDYIQSKILAELMSLKKTSIKDKFDIELLNVNDSIAQVLEMTNLINLFRIREDYGSYPLEVLFDKFLDDVVASDISKYLAGNYSDKIRDKLIELAKEGNPVKTEYAILTMGRAQDFSSVDIFRKALESPFNNIKIAAILALGWLGDTQAKDGLYVYLVNSDTDLAEAAAASIALLSDSTDSEKLDIYLNHQNSKVRIIAAQALSLINDDKGYHFIAKRLERETNEQVRVTLTRWLSFFNIEGVGGLLINLLEDGSIAVREAAASGLVRIGVGKYAKTLLDKVGDKDSWVGFFAAKALVGSKNPEIINGLQSLYINSEPNVKLAIIEALGKSGLTDPGFFVSKLQDYNEDIRKEALNSLQLVNPQKATESALRIYGTDPSWLVRYKAVEIITASKPEGYEALLRERLSFEKNRYIKEKIVGTVGE